MVTFGANASPAKDVDIVVSFSESLAGGTLMGISGGSGADAQFTFTATITDPAAYRAEVVGMVKAAQRDMLSLLKP